MTQKSRNPMYEYGPGGKYEDSRFWVLLEALKKISAGEGYYGLQAREYKQIARAALAIVGYKL